MKKFVTVGLAVLTLASAVGGSALAQRRPLGDKDHDGLPNVLDNHDDRWDPHWGKVVVAPRGWDKKRPWNHHVGLCRTRYPSYDARRDMYRLHNRWVRCTLR